MQLFTKKNIFKFIKNYRIIENLILLLSFLFLYFSLKYLITKYEILVLVNKNTWSYELFLYSLFLIFIIYFGQLVLNKFLELNFIKSYASEHIKNIIFINKFVIKIVLFISIITSIFILSMYLNKMEISVYDNIIGFIFYYSMISITIIGILNYWLNIFNIIIKL